MKYKLVAVFFLIAGIGMAIFGFSSLSINGVAGAFSILLAFVMLYVAGSVFVRLIRSPND